MGHPHLETESPNATARVHQALNNDMTAERIVDCLLDLDSAACLEALLGEASIHRPRRGRIWVAAFRDEHGERWQSTGLTDRKAARAKANEMEAEARRKRAELGIQTRPKIRVRAGTGEQELLDYYQEHGVALPIMSRLAEKDCNETKRRDGVEGNSDPAFEATPPTRSRQSHPSVQGNSSLISASTPTPKPT
jgi:hypothetical protein